MPRPSHPAGHQFPVWADKIARNIERDTETTAYLRETGWTVLRFWEHEDPEAVANQVQEAVESALAGSA